MTLTTHALVGAAVASLVPQHPILGFSLAFASHFLLDAIPHWDYSLHSMIKDESNPLNNDIKLNKDFIFDLIKIGFDALCGLLLALFLFTFHGPQLFLAPVLGVVGALMPDALQFVYWKWRHEPFSSLQRFHLWIHSDKHHNKNPAIGIPLQLAVILAVVLMALNYIH